MATDLLRAIQSLNSQSFSDYQHLIFDLKEVINKYENDSHKKVIQDKNLNDYEFRGNSIDYLIEIYNKKLGEFVSNFFWGEELIRREVSNNPGLLKEIHLDTFNYLWPITFNSLEPSNGPAPIDSAMARTNYFEAKYKSDYFLKPELKKVQQKEGCFIATYAFDSYDHIYVKMLRKYRDENLANNFFGKKFIVVYYRYSPLLVTFFSRIRFPKILIRRILKYYIAILSFALRKDFHN